MMSIWKHFLPNAQWHKHRSDDNFTTLIHHYFCFPEWSQSTSLCPSQLQLLLLLVSLKEWTEVASSPPVSQQWTLKVSTQPIPFLWLTDFTIHYSWALEVLIVKHDPYVVQDCQLSWRFNAGLFRIPSFQAPNSLLKYLLNPTLPVKPVEPSVHILNLDIAQILEIQAENPMHQRSTFSRILLKGSWQFQVPLAWPWLHALHTQKGTEPWGVDNWGNV